MNHIQDDIHCLVPKNKFQECSQVTSQKRATLWHKNSTPLRSKNRNLRGKSSSLRSTVVNSELPFIFRQQGGWFST